MFFFTVNLLLKFFLVTATNGDTGILKSFHTFLNNVCTTCWGNLNNIVCSELHENLSCFTKQTNKQTNKQPNKQTNKNNGFRTIFDKALISFWKKFLQLKQLFNMKTTTSVFQKLR